MTRPRDFIFPLSLSLSLSLWLSIAYQKTPGENITRVASSNNVFSPFCVFARRYYCGRRSREALGRWGLWKRRTIENWQRKRAKRSASRLLVVCRRESALEVFLSLSFSCSILSPTISLSPAGPETISTTLRNQFRQYHLFRKRGMQVLPHTLSLSSVWPRGIVDTRSFVPFDVCCSMHWLSPLSTPPLAHPKGGTCR